ncbi:pyridoxamine 5'-phosphate oxidase family protein [Fontisubflavum oceani]|uniref:HugZ family pyridoxamine 5'-phosphate oxidase n=1 Tax=Fontisubflavum oceani TaxID=2978973 RepID=UPI0025B3D08D|nr:pyridoxamine 5'-phosphate oxidase family protein [Fontisubflavum oceani]WJY23002.1 pyridoxamine 5'-phosphate oxidase family protein [Fontisubflavum oceani]
MTRQTSVIRDTDDEARALARKLIDDARFGTLGVLDPKNGAPMVSRIAVVPDEDGTPLTLISDLSSHSAALAANPACSLLLGEPGAKGDPLTYPRLTLQCRAERADKDGLRAHYLAHYPKAQVYYNFTDFRLVRLQITCSFLNGGFGKAFHLTTADLAR